jgi:hypothetical protein
MIGLPIGLALVTSGLIAAPVGAIEYFNSFSPSITVQAMNVGLVPARGSVPVRDRAGAGLGVRMAF